MTSEAALIEAAIAEMRAGNFRPCAKVLATRAGYDQSRINRRFGSIELMRRCLAREHWERIAGLAGLQDLPERERRRLVWLIMVGTTRTDYAAREMRGESGNG